MMTFDEMKNIIETEVPLGDLQKNKGIYEFHLVGSMSIGVSYEEDEDGDDTYIFNLFWQKDEYINISGNGFHDETIHELVKEWNRLEKIA